MKPPKDDVIDVDWKTENVNVTLHVGDVIRCRFHRHGSVGEDAEFEIGDTNILMHDDTTTEYTHPEHMKKPGWTGGDGQRGYWYFKAISSGSTKLTIRILFRFKVESTHVVDINVK
ncbi:MAG: hypothetical protein P1Q69_20335 [Candidatus Thorarchaeota archaeon]|nr:hypothetical protein [Candidatus Thorarchaeota archaeon]